MTARRRWVAPLASGLPLALLLAAFALRVFRLGDENVWWDEGLAIWAVRKSLVETTLWTASDVHPPLFFWTLWGWIRLVGESTFAARYLMVLWSVLLAAVAYALGRRVAGWRGGVLALALVAVSRYLIWWSMELRMYVLAGLAVAGAAYATLRWLDAVPAVASGSAPGATPGGGSSRTARAALVGYGIAATAALYTVYMTAAAPAVCNAVVLGAWLVARRRRSSRPAPGPAPESDAPLLPPPQPTAAPTPFASWRDLAPWIAVQGAVALLFVPWLALALPRMQSWTVVAEPASFAFVLQLWSTLLATGISVVLDAARVLTWTWWLAALLLPAAWWLLHDRRRHVPASAVAEDRSAQRSGLAARPAPWLLALFVAFPPLLVWAATQPRSLFYSPNVEARYFLPFAVPTYVVAAWLLAGVWRRRPTVAAVLTSATLITMLLVLPGHYRERRLRDAFASMSMAIWSQAEPGDGVLLVSGNRYPLFLFDYDQPWERDHGTDFRYLAPDLAAPPGRPPVIPFPDRGSAAIGGSDWQGRLALLLARHPRLWLAAVDAHMQDPDDRVQAWLEEHATRVLSEGYGTNALHLFAADGKAPRVTQVVAGWPGLRPWPGRPEPGFQPVVGLPVMVAMPGDTPSVTLFRDLAVPTGARQPTHLLWLAWPQGWAPTSSARLMGSSREGKGVERLRGVVPVSEWTPAGRAPLGLWLDEAGLGELTVRGTEPGQRRPAPVEAEVGPLRLTGALVMPRKARPGGRVVVDLIWERRRPVSPQAAGRSSGAAAPWAFLGARPPVVFAHLVGPPHPLTGDTLWAVQDGPPSSGGWGEQGGSRVFDRHVLDLDPRAPPGTYTLEVGLYDPETGERYPVSGDGADASNGRIILGTVEVSP